MPKLMRCKYCGTLQDEPKGAKVCVQCGGELAFVDQVSQPGNAYLTAQLELDQVAAPAEQIVERHLIITVETPDAVPPGEQAPTATGREPLNFVAVLDISGSMGGTKIRSAKEAVRQAVQRLQDGDYFSLVTFSTDVRCPLASKRVDAGFRRVIASSLQEIRAGGQTALCGGLEMGIEQSLVHAQKTNLVLLLSDGQANVGETDIEAVGRRAIDARARGITVSTLGVGHDYNEALMAEIAIDGGGRFYHIASATQIAAYLSGELGEMASLAARHATVTLNLPAGTGIHPFSSAYPVQGQTIALGDIPLSTTLEVVVRLLLPPQSAGSRLSIDGELRYTTPADNVLTTPLNKVTVRYDTAKLFEFAAGTVKPVVRRVLGQMQATGVLSTARAATRSLNDARRQSDIQLAAMQEYALLLGKDQEAEKVLAESQDVLGAMAMSSSSPRAKAATFVAMRRQRGTKDFGDAT
jgi:Ca-activated chloride channel family protein